MFTNNRQMNFKSLLQSVKSWHLNRTLWYVNCGQPGLSQGKQGINTYTGSPATGTKAQSTRERSHIICAGQPPNQGCGAEGARRIEYNFKLKAWKTTTKQNAFITQPSCLCSGTEECWTSAEHRAPVQWSLAMKWSLMNDKHYQHTTVATNVPPAPRIKIDNEAYVASVPP